MYDPFLLENISEGVEILYNSLINKEKIFLIVDCDNDGVTSAAMIYNYCKKNFPDVDIQWMMHSGKQHGIEIDRIPKDSNLILVPDAGSNQLEEHKQLYNLGMKILVIDHHETDIDLNDSPACIINNQISNYPNKDLSGAGVVLKFLQVFDRKIGKEDAKYFYDLAAVGIVGDMMNLNDPETRYIIKTGLSEIRNSGLKGFIEKQSFSIKNTNELTPTDISFYITPLINAIIRVGTQEEKELLFRAFIEGELEEKSSKRGAKPGDIEKIKDKAARIAANAKARQKKAIEKSLDFLEMKIQKEELLDNKILIIALDESESDYVNPNLTGLIAMNLLAKYGKPTLVMRLADDGIFKGSGRGNNHSELNNLKTYLSGSNYFDFAEGHECAFGCGISGNNIDRFIQKSNEDLKEMDFSNSYLVDFKLNPSEIAEIEKMAYDFDGFSQIWGKEVEEPVIAVHNISFSPEEINIIGKTSDTIKFQKNGISFMKFKDSDLAKKLSDIKTPIIMDLIGSVQINRFLGNETPQFIISDYSIIQKRFIF